MSYYIYVDTKVLISKESLTSSSHLRENRKTMSISSKLVIIQFVVLIFLPVGTRVW